MTQQNAIRFATSKKSWEQWITGTHSIHPSIPTYLKLYVNFLASVILVVASHEQGRSLRFLLDAYACINCSSYRSRYVYDCYLPYFDPLFCWAHRGGEHLVDLIWLDERSSQIQSIVLIAFLLYFIYVFGLSIVNGT